MGKQNRLTAVECKKAKATDKLLQLHDGGGLYLSVDIDGSKTWKYRYTKPNGDRGWTGFGSFEDVSLSEARDKRDKFKQSLKIGINPVEVKRADKKKIKDDEANQFHEIYKAWIATPHFKDLAPNYVSKIEGYFEGFIIPHFETNKEPLKTKSIKEISEADIEAVLSLKANTAVETAYRMFAQIKDLFEFARAKRLIEYNICHNIRLKDVLPKKQGKHYPKIVDEIVLNELLNAIDNYKGWMPVKVCLQVAPYLMLRASNLVNLKWSQIDFEKKVISNYPKLISNLSPYPISTFST